MVGGLEERVLRVVAHISLPPLPVEAGTEVRTQLAGVSCQKYMSIALQLSLYWEGDLRNLSYFLNKSFKK